MPWPSESGYGSAAILPQLGHQLVVGAVFDVPQILNILDAIGTEFTFGEVVHTCTAFHGTEIIQSLSNSFLGVLTRKVDSGIQHQHGIPAAECAVRSGHLAIFFIVQFQHAAQFGAFGSILNSSKGAAGPCESNIIGGVAGNFDGEHLDCFLVKAVAFIAVIADLLQELGHLSTVGGEEDAIGFGSDQIDALTGIVGVLTAAHFTGNDFNTVLFCKCCKCIGCSHGSIVILIEDANSCIVNDKDFSQQAKEYFAQIRKTDRLIHRLDSTIATLRSSLTSTGSQLKQDKVQTSGPKNTLEETITKIIDLEAKINARIDELVSMKQEAFTMINRIPDLDQQNILIGRYIQLKKWEDISEELNYSMQWVFELHGKGLLAFAKANSDFLNNRENQSATGSKQSKESVE